jgi:hypothetical protein
VSLLTLELEASAVLIDEAVGRGLARMLGLLPIGVLGTLVRAKQRGLIGVARPLIDQLKNELGFFISKPLRDEILRNAGESWTGVDVQPDSSKNESDEEQEETLEAIRRGLADVGAGRVTPAREALVDPEWHTCTALRPKRWKRWDSACGFL